MSETPGFNEMPYTIEEPIEFSHLSEEDISNIEKIGETASYSPDSDSFKQRGYIFNRVNYSFLRLKYLIGHLFFARDDQNNRIAFAICFDCKKGELPKVSDNAQFEHEVVFWRELSKVGPYVYLDQVVVHTEHRKGVGISLIKKLTDFYRDKGSLIVAGVVHEKNFFSLKVLLFGLEWKALDFYEHKFISHPALKENNCIWLRVYKLLRPSETILNDISPDQENISLLIKLRFQEIANRINRLYSLPLGSDARIVWSGWVLHDTDTEIQKTMRASGFCEYLSIVNERRKISCENGVMDSVLRFYETRERGESASVVSYMINDPHWLVISNISEDLPISLPFGKLKKIHVDDEKEKTAFSLANNYGTRKELWYPWVEIYKKLYSNDKILWGRDIRWLHLIGPVWSNREYGQDLMVGVFFTLVYPENISEKNIRYLSSNISLAIDAFGGCLNGILVHLKNRKARAHATRSAASAILARNMSHNIGSHVTPRTRLEDLRGRIQGFFLTDAADPSRWGFDEWRVGFNVLKELKDTLDEYEQRKAEFIAEFSTDPLISSREAWFYREVVLPFLCNTALLDTLAANEGFGYKTADQPGIIIRCFRKKSDEDPEELWAWFSPEKMVQPRRDELRKSIADRKQGSHIPYGLRTLENRSDIHVPTIEGGDGDVRVSLPGPVGEMAFYSILENLIRNAAKHGGLGGDTRAKTLEIHIVIREEDASGDHYRVDIHENLSSPSTEILGKINKYLEKSIVEDDGQVRKEAWGLAEMGLCANLLMDRAPGESQTVPELKVGLQYWDRIAQDPSCKCKREFLTYSLRLKKAWTAVFFGFESVDKEQSLRDAGFRFEDGAALVGGPRGEDGMPPAFQFAVLDAGLINNHTVEETGNILNRLPFRIIVVGNVADANKETFRKRGIACAEKSTFGHAVGGSAEDLTRWLWREWLGFLRTKTEGKEKVSQAKPLAVDVYFMQGEKQKPTADWKKTADRFNADPYNSDPAKGLPIRVGVWAKDLQTGSVDVITGQKPPDEEDQERRIVIDRHGDFCDKSARPPSMADRLIVIDKASDDFDTLYNARFDNPKGGEQNEKHNGLLWQLPFELAEAGLVRILLLDERIAQRAGDNFQEIGAAKTGFKKATTGSERIHPKNGHIAERAGIHIATHLSISADDGNIHTLDLAKGDWSKDYVYSSGKFELEARFEIHGGEHLLRITDRPGMGPMGKGPLRDMSEAVDLVIIHQGILDRVRGKFDDKGHDKDHDKDMSKTLRRSLESGYWLIVESGRGIPPEVQDSHSKFLPFSLIERAFRGGRAAKLGLTRTVMAATRNKRS